MKNFLAKVVFLTLLVFLGYLIYIFIPIWSFSLSNTSGVAKVVSLTDNTLVYSYYNEFKQEEIKLERAVRNKTDLQKIEVGVKFEIEYSNFSPNYVFFVDVDSQTPIYLTLIVLCLTLISIWLYILVLKGRISLKVLLGVR